MVNVLKCEKEKKKNSIKNIKKKRKKKEKEGKHKNIRAKIVLLLQRVDEVT